MKKIIILLAAVSGMHANAQSWNLTGNSGTVPGTNFIGTTDNQPLVFKANNTELMKITPKGRIIFQNMDTNLGWDTNLFLGGGNEIATGKANTSVGMGSLINDTTGGANTAVGSNSGRAITTGASNTAIGSNSMINGNVGNGNTGVGANSLGGLGSMAENTALGTAALGGYSAVATDNITENTAVGAGSLTYLRNGSRNISIGKRAMRTFTTGNDNIVIGTHAAEMVIEGNQNIFIGSRVQANAASVDNQLNIGNWIIGNNGTIGIGQFATQLPADGISSDGIKYKLFVKDGIRTEKVKVDIAANNGWADYVFAKDYQLMPLNDLAKFIDKNGHLPEVPTTEEAIKNGIELKEMNILLLKKVEELTLHLIDQNKELKTQKEEIEALKSKVNSL
ncbi:hypothetical protein C1631_012395 [Chryseobacterium phosphatilyticum]|uniref:Peptidase S74 domain-containing protein n=1 Tax=Chryseobacterium phosphatilyticum TaxID=475075 RepID=A0A316X506_9FLAO|nr:hypothetical protein [Chryseobacterium phosphatilyticum]PWN68875.1 hypothetical protein C1631_012395 [Chryseobacterium phosphatilyticum]